MAMTIISKPPGRGPLFGEKVVILLGGVDRDAMRRWKGRVRTAPEDEIGQESDEKSAGD